MEEAPGARYEVLVTVADLSAVSVRARLVAAGLPAPGTVARVAAQYGPAIAILDATPVWHTRPLGGELYRNHPEMDPARDVERLIVEYGLSPEELSTQYTWDRAVCERDAPWAQRLVQGLRRLNRIRRMKRRIRRLRRAAAHATSG